MHIIPVLDLMNGQVVHAERGQRHLYRPVHSPLCPLATVEAVVDAYMSIFPFDTLYVADLDAIRECGNNDAVLERLLLNYPGLTLWMDQGRRSHAPGNHRVRPVLGTETGMLPDHLINHLHSSPSPVLSLDFSNGSLIGSSRMLEEPRYWPKDLILLDLSRVGSREGPDLDLLARVSAIAGKRNIYLGGGIHGPADLAAAEAAGAAGALIATALHDRTIGSAELVSNKQKKTPA